MPPVHESEGTADGENDEPKPENEENLLVQDVQREEAHCVEFLRGVEINTGSILSVSLTSTCQYYQYYLFSISLTSTWPTELWVKKSHFVILGKTSCIGSTWNSCHMNAKQDRKHKSTQRNESLKTV